MQYVVAIHDKVCLTSSPDPHENKGIYFDQAEEKLIQIVHNFIAFCTTSDNMWL